jgi:hypothetical protein
MFMVAARAVPAEEPPSAATDLARLRKLLDDTGTVPSRGHGGRGTSGDHGLPVPDGFAELLPGGLPRGSVVGLDDDRYLAAALVGAAVRDAGCAALIGMNELGVEAIAAAGAPLEHLVLVDVPAEAWIEAAEAMLGSVDVLLLRPPTVAGPGLVRRITARLRRGAAHTALLVAGAWPAPVRLSVARAQWTGLDAGHGQLVRRSATVTARGQGSWSRPGSAEVWLPATDGSSQPRAAEAGIGVGTGSGIGTGTGESAAGARRRLHLVGSPPPAA